jgi:cytochrome P450|tara:strand:- start:6265 stop:7506 length:1242 start_codon:yes stop_codon:yes gene_type:complete
MQNLMDPAVQACPYSLYQQLRSESPIYRMPETGFYLVTTFDLCHEIIRQPDLFISGVSPMALNSEGVPREVMEVYEQQGWVPAASCSTSDRPRHTKVRGLLSQLFTMAKVRSMAPYIEETANNLIEGFAASGECEFVKAFSHPLPMIVIAEQIGVNSRDLELFKRWSDAIVEPFGMMISKEREVECAKLVVEMQHFFKEQIDLRRREPRNDILSQLANAEYEGGEAIPMNELLTIVTIDLLASGNETTTAGISSGMLLLAEQPELLTAMQDDPDLIPTFVEEVLRLESPAQGMFREVTQDTTVGGVALRKGDVLSLRFGAANRDEKIFQYADRVDLQRKKAGNHLAFGVGRHHCVGAPLARQEMLISFQVIAQRLRNIRLKNPQAPLKYTPSFFGRNLESLEITFEASGSQQG